MNPYCLTISLGSACSLSCIYCYAAKESKAGTAPGWQNDHVLSLAEWIAANCRREQKPFALCFHGGNEPLQYVNEIVRCIEKIEPVCRRHQIPLQVFTTTSGVVSRESLIQACQLFTGITLSWDGPPAVHDQNRPFADGRPSCRKVEQTYQLMAQMGVDVTVRSTITSTSCDAHLAIIRYFAEHHVRRVVFHPVYQDEQRSIPSHLFPTPNAFVRFFLQSRQWGAENGIIVTYSGVRLEQCHDQFCPPLQHNVSVTVDGYLTFCFLITMNSHKENNHLIYGDILDGHPFLHVEKLAALEQRARQPFDQCADCFIQDHCSKACPAVCPLRDDAATRFDCRINQWIGAALLLERFGYCLTDQDMDNPAILIDKAIDTLRFRSRVLEGAEEASSPAH
ncbi:MAG: hypothetical protein EHM72_17680 [Calditrichaeota bacterium]|nr:MAG: hypothetical protein EHM72_17680 [Calditrichota bacterium]